jgi:hypothetical protein
MLEAIVGFSDGSATGQESEKEEGEDGGREGGGVVEAAGATRRKTTDWSHVRHAGPLFVNILVCADV